MHVQKFWLVWNPAGRVPTVQHSSREAAEAEATRLAEKELGAFYVLEAVQVVYSFANIVTEKADLT